METIVGRYCLSYGLQILMESGDHMHGVDCKGDSFSVTDCIRNKRRKRSTKLENLLVTTLPIRIIL